jgi:hypothetical protein
MSNYWNAYCLSQTLILYTSLGFRYDDWVTLLPYSKLVLVQTAAALSISGSTVCFDISTAYWHCLTHPPTPGELLLKGALSNMASSSRKSPQLCYDDVILLSAPLTLWTDWLFHSSETFSSTVINVNMVSLGLSYSIAFTKQPVAES